MMTMFAVMIMWFFAVIFQILIYRTLILMQAISVLSVLIIGAAFGS